MRIASVLAFLWLAAVVGAAGAERIRPLLDEANRRFARWELARAEELVRRAWLDGDGTAEERVEANTRIMKLLAEWMEVHSAEIAGLDPSRPLLPQFDRLTDDQMRAAFRSMDPRAQTEAKK